ncbi:MAG: hypothetical protein IPK22_26830 [Verrucomicrobiaceae bacterium]|nr:hypothetical protein [Verrucomicrobiaceae bacterium]
MSEYGLYSRPSSAMQAWIAEVEDFVISNFGRESSPWRVFGQFDRRKLDGFSQDEFGRQKEVIVSSLKACMRVQPRLGKPSFDSAAVFDTIFDRFHHVARRLRSRHSSRETLDVKDEYDVQDLLAALLKVHFDDIRTEEWTPSYAGGSARMDFLLKNEKTVIEVKMTRKGLSDREVGNQLIEDVVRYKSHPDCKRLICFVYDPEGWISNPHGISNDLTRTEEDFEVQIRIKPNL